MKSAQSASGVLDFERKLAASPTGLPTTAVYRNQISSPDGCAARVTSMSRSTCRHGSVT
jgi:hypothetical protein